MLFKTKPVIIEAVKFHLREYADNPLVFEDLPVWLQTAIAVEIIKPVFKSEDYWYLEIKTLEGVMTVSPGDWIIKGLKGEIYPCKPDIFEQKYERHYPQGNW